MPARLDACAEGLGCLLSGDVLNPDGLVCAQFCDPDGGTPDCAGISPGDLECVRINEFYSDLDNVRNEIGICVPPGLLP